ncbi:hypothetical protein TrispH2_000817 [Trichoplax sp. H2]|uniref:Sel1 repeat family protein n=1 Tax=Trichoplax adhaerens TaxID=10228 RepID=B3S7Q8_TRIAD|nr:predicted protein [Trichoplax adhaerens]EDV21238.1 predicted protein [Trichoplax adhaerens]RDD47613.1 hypothetical protein TrispH2_000817 [Trichoplax sp. H2]|eukprot:XP_002116205.1 predicted protein [Trichoplax adhaerens]
MEEIAPMLEKFIQDDYINQAILDAKEDCLHHCQSENNAHAYYQLGQFYYQDWSDNQLSDLSKALNYFEKASQGNHPIAMYMLYVLLGNHEEEVQKLYGHLSEQDLMLKRGKLCLKAASQGRRSCNAHKEITHTIIHSISWRETYLKILEEYKQTIEIEEKNLQSENLGQLYNMVAYLLWMTNEERDLQIFTQAINYFKKSSWQYQYAAGYYNLADWALSAYANIIDDDFDEDITECMKLAGELGHPLALYHLANESINPDSDSNQRNMRMSDYLTRSSTSLGYAETLVCLGCLHLHGINDGQSDFKLAKRYFRQACLAPSYEESHWIGSHWAYHQLAYIFEKGLDDTKQYSLAGSLYAQAGLLKNYHSFCKLAKLIEKKRLENANIALAIRLYQTAATYDEDTAGYANYRLGKIYLNDAEHVDANKSKRCFRLAYKFYKSEIELCANAGHYYRLGLMHHFGYGIGLDQTKASKLYQKCIYEARLSHNISIRHYRQKAINKLNILFDDENYSQQLAHQAPTTMQSMMEKVSRFDDPSWQEMLGLDQAAVLEENHALKKRMSQIEETLELMKKRLTLNISDQQQLPIHEQTITEEQFSSPQSDQNENNSQQVEDDVYIDGVKLRKKKASPSTPVKTNNIQPSRGSPNLANENQQLKQANNRLTLEVSELKEQVKRLSVIINKASKETDL